MGKQKNIAVCENGEAFDGPAAKRKILCFEWARGIAAAMVVLIHVMMGIMDNYPMEVVGGVALSSGH